MGQEASAKHMQSAEVPESDRGVGKHMQSE